MVKSFKAKLITNLAIALVLLSLFLLVIFLLGKNIENKVGVISETNRELASGFASLNELTRLRGLKAEADPHIARLNASILSKNDLFGLSADLRSIANSHNLEFSFDFKSEPGETQGLARVPFDLNVQGNLADITSFIEELEETYSLMNLLSVDILRRGDGYSSTINGEIIFNAGDL